MFATDQKNADYIDHLLYPATKKTKPLTVKHTTYAPISTSTFDRTIQDQTDQIVNHAKFNYDLTPYQPVVLQKKGGISLLNSKDREEMIDSSQFLKKHTYDRLWKIVSDGWELDEGETPEWTPDEEDAFITGISDAMVIDTTFVVLFAGDFYVFTHNDVFSQIVVNEKKEPIEVYLQFPEDGHVVVYNENGDTSTSKFQGGVFGFLTQYSKEVAKVPSIKCINQSFLDGQGGLIYRDCVMITPRKYHKNIFGKPYLSIENEIALQKLYLRGYEFAFLHKGGVERFVAVPKGASGDDVISPLVDASRRGIMEPAVIYEYEGGTGDVKNQIMINTQPIPSIPFESINSMVSEDAELTKQKIQGAAETGALGGQAPKINQDEDNGNQVDKLKYIAEKVIRDFNFVFHDKDGYEIEEMAGGRIRKKPAYRVIYHDIVEMDQNEIGQGMDKPENESLQAKNPVAQVEANSWGLGVTIDSHSVATIIKGQNYVEYDGNLFEAGDYKHPERNDEIVTYTPEEIEDFTKLPFNKVPLELSPHKDPDEVGLGSHIGFLDVQGYNSDSKKDQTKFFIKEEYDKMLRDLGIIKEETIIKDGKKLKRSQFKVSPLFSRRNDPVTQKKNIFLKTAAVVDTRFEKPRSALTNLDTSAKNELEV